MHPTPTPPAWTYQPPKHPEAYPEQCYYRAGEWHHLVADGVSALAYPRITLYRDELEPGARITLDVEAGEVRADLTVGQLTALRDALNDALQDIAANEADRERRESFDAISEELREAAERGDDGQTGVLYAHPDVHYVSPDQVQAKVAELEAAGAKRYIVLPIDPADGADDARNTRHYPSLEGEAEAA